MAARPRVARWAGSLALVVLLLALGLPGRALGHGGAGAASDLYTAPERISPPVAGAEMRSYGGDDKIELRLAEPERTVTVLGYLGEPYLRVGPEGAFENRASPSIDVAEGADVGDLPARAFEAPSWRRISAAPVAVWHDQRASEPPASGRVAREWRIPVLVDGKPGAITGSIRRGNAPSTVPLVVLGLGLALAAGLLAGRARHSVARATTVAATALATGAAVTIAVDEALAAPRDGLASGSASGLSPIVTAGLWIGVASGGLALVVATRRRRQLQAVTMLGVALLVAATAVLARLGHFVSPFLPGSLPEDWTRVLLASALGFSAASIVWVFRTFSPQAVESHSPWNAPSRFAPDATDESVGKPQPEHQPRLE